jgi:hypothetical protein
MTNHEKHIMMWDELAETGSPYKQFTRVHICYPSTRTCYACVEANNKRTCYACVEAKNNCEYCPIDWGTSCCEDKGSPYTKWFFAETTKTRKKYAAIIRDLVWRER